PAQPARRTPLTVAPQPASGTLSAAAAPAVASGSTLSEPQADPWFKPRSLGEEAQVKVLSVAGEYPYFAIHDSGCGAGKRYLHAELLGGFDGLPAGTAVVLRVEDAALGVAGTGATLAFSGLRRAGKTRDGTYVYCAAATPTPARR
ncbi:MAG TPA: hypothetical protein VE782_03575, partial [Myxococcaceae bacterium]|nr:hypothetical protein [Myxococcaceae bacterium]